jgi:hypothetical protein
MVFYRSSGYARLPTTHAAAVTLDSHTRCHAISTQSLCHTVSTRAHHLADDSTSRALADGGRRRRGRHVAGPVARAPARPLRLAGPVSCAHCAEPWCLSTSTTPHWRGLAPVCKGTRQARSPRAHPAHCCCVLRPLSLPQCACAPAHVAKRTRHARGQTEDARPTSRQRHHPPAGRDADGVFVKALMHVQRGDEHEVRT